jgi:hypothetical protein
LEVEVLTAREVIQIAALTTFEDFGMLRVMNSVTIGAELPLLGEKRSLLSGWRAAGTFNGYIIHADLCESFQPINIADFDFADNKVVSKMKAFRPSSRVSVPSTTGSSLAQFP